MTLINARHVQKKFRKKQVLTDVTFTLEPGGVHGLLGRNGVGKSTLMRIIAGQLKLNGGELTVFGERPFDRASVMDRVCLTGVDVEYPDSWNANDILNAAALRYPNWDLTFAEQLCNDFDLGAAVSTQYAKMSRGQRAMIGIIVGLASGAELTLLDEPYVGLDTHNTKVFYRHLLAQADGRRTFIMATHHIDEAAKILDSALILGRDGKISAHVAADEADELLAAYGIHDPLRVGDFGDVIEHLLEVS